MDICTAKACQKNQHCQSLCSMHYARFVRTGTTEKLPRAKPHDTVHVGGNYLLTHAPEHPLARGKSNRVYAHRIAFYDAHGEGPFSCYHCGKSVDWSFMHVDHLDDDTQNNHLTNLVASCPVCNQKRGFHKSKEANKARGMWVEYGNLKLPVADFAKALGLSKTGLKTRLANWPIYRAVLLAPGAMPDDRTAQFEGVRAALEAKAKKYTHDGRHLSVRGWADLMGVPVKAMAYLIRTHGIAQAVEKAEARP